MKKFLILIMVTMSLNVYGQMTSDVYIIGTSAPISDENHTGFSKWTSKKLDAYDRGLSMTFTIESAEKGYFVNLNHYNRKSSPKQIVKMERHMLASLNVIDADEFVKTHTKEQAYDWMRAHVGKRIWVIDRNDFFVSSTTGKEMMQLIETTVNAEQLPSPPEDAFDKIL